MVLIATAYLKAIVSTDTAAASAKLATFGKQIDAVGARTDTAVARIGRGFSKVGAGMSKWISAPLALAGAASVKMALDFNQSFATISALAGKLGVSMDKAKAKVLQLAGETAQSPEDLAKALYFVASAGLKASQVMPVLEMSAKGAATGMGDVETIAQTLTSLLNAYAGTGLTAAKAMNIMTAAVKNGKAEASDFATGLGPVIGVAAQAGVSFNDLAAAIAQATNLGVPFARAVTGLRFLIASLENPTDKAKAALKGIGVSVQDVADSVAKPGGLEHTLQNLASRFDLTTAKGRAAFNAIVGGARGGIVAMDLIGKHTEQTNKIVGKLGASAKSTAKDFQTAFGKATSNDLFKARQAMARLQSDLIIIGEKLLPIFEKILGVVSKWIDAFDRLSPSAQNVAIKIGLIAIAAGPVLRIFGGLIGMSARLAGAFSGVGAAAEEAAAGTAAIAEGGGIAAGAGALGPLAAIGAGIAAAVLAARSAQKGLHETTQNVSNDLKTNAGDFQKWSHEARTAADQVHSKWTSIGGGKGGQGIAAASLQADSDAIKQGIGAYRQWERATFSTTAAQRQFEQVTKHTTGVTVGQAEAIGRNVEAIHLLGGRLSRLKAQQVANLLAEGDFRDAMKILQGVLANTTNKTNRQASAHQVAADKAFAEAHQSDLLKRALNSLPKAVQTRVSTPGLGTAIDGVRTLKALLDSIHDVHSTIFTTTVRTYRTEAGQFGTGASGGVIGLQGGAFVTRRRTYLVGEGGYPTPAGPGAEMIAPLGGSGGRYVKQFIRDAVREAMGPGASGVSLPPIIQHFHGTVIGTSQEFRRSVMQAVGEAVGGRMPR